MNDLECPVDETLIGIPHSGEVRTRTTQRGDVVICDGHAGHIEAWSQILATHGTVQGR